MQVKGYILAIITAVSFGLIPLFMIPLKATGIVVDSILFYRFLVAAAALLFYLLYSRETLRITIKELGIFASLGLLYALSAEFLFLGYDYTSPGIASTILFVYPVIVVLILSVFYKEKITKTTAISLLITLLGVFVLSLKDASFHINILGLVICMAGAISYAIYMIIVNKATYGHKGMKVTFYSLLFSAVYYLIKMVALGETILLPNTKALLDISVFSLVTTVLSVTTLIYAIKYIGSTPTAIIGGLEPVAAVFISVNYFFEPMTATLFSGVLLIISGVTLNIISDGIKNSKAKKKRVPS